ncbi:MAG TPA: hypothetical protein VF508_02190, partial [Pyrinomonadaceae bacterium]
MTAAAVAALLLAAFAARAQTGGGASPAPDAGRVSLLFTALGKDGKFVEGLKAEDLRLTVDGSPREVLELKRQKNTPLFLAVVIDTSASQERLLPSTKIAADYFVRGAMVVGVDEAAVVTFSGETVLEQGVTGDLDRVRAAIARVRFVPPPGYQAGGILVGTPGGGDLRNAASTG